MTKRRTFTPVEIREFCEDYPDSDVKALVAYTLALRRALKPFAKFADDCCRDYPGWARETRSGIFLGGGDGQAVRGAHFTRARSLLPPPPARGKAKKR